MLKIIVNCGPAEEYIAKCLFSIRSQSYENWEAYVTIDPCGDKTHREAVLARGVDSRIHIHKNSRRRYSMANLIRAISRSGALPEDIIVVLDGDDWFATSHALRLICETYVKFDCWMTYGSWVSDQPDMYGKWPAYPDGTADFRNSEWLGTAVRTWKRWLWDLIDDNDFRDAGGKYFRVTEDRASVLPMLEMSGTRKAKHIEQVLMIYNRSSPHACCYTCRDEMLANAEYLKKRPRYWPLIDKPEFELAPPASVHAKRKKGLRTRLRNPVPDLTRDHPSI